VIHSTAAGRFLNSWVMLPSLVASLATAQSFARNIWDA